MMGSIVLSAPIAGWVSALDEVPDGVFSARLLGDGVAIDPVEGLLCAPCDGEILSVHAARHAVTMAGEGGVELLMHLGIDTVELKGDGFETLVQAGHRVVRGQPLLRFSLDDLAGRAPSLVSPVIVTNGDRFTISSCTVDALVAVGDDLIRLDPVEVAPSPDRAPVGEAVGAIVVVPLPNGVHARPAARLGEAARAFAAETRIVKNGRAVSTRSPVGLLGLSIQLGDEILVEASGPDASQAVAALVDLIRSGLGEGGEHEAAAEPRASSAGMPPFAPVPDGALRGTLASPGFALGTCHRLDRSEPELPVQGKGREEERIRLLSAMDHLRSRLAISSEVSPKAAICRAHRALLDDPELEAAALSRIAEGEDAAHAWREACRASAVVLRGSGSARFAERADDVLDLGRQLVTILTGELDETLAFPPGTILLADELLPSQIMQLGAEVTGIALANGGPTSHVAILAASMGIPMLVAIGDALAGVRAGDKAILDADGGFLLPAPGAAALAEAEAEVAARQARRADALASASELCHSRDGARIEVFANLGSLDDARRAVSAGAEGCGLLRTEFLFLERESAPTVAQQAELYAGIADALGGRPLIVRLLDIGGDKPATYLPIAPEANPALGLRGIRVGLTHPDVLEDQLRAILSVERGGALRIMVPMVTGVAEVREVRQRVDRISAELGLAQRVEVGIMVETPAAAATAFLLAPHADFMSIGTNDLTQYVLAMDRDNPAVAGGIDGLHPAVLNLIAQTVRGAQSVGRWTGVCGGLAADRLAVPLLLGLGVTELSVPLRQLPEIKALVRGLSISDCKTLALEALQLESAAEIRALSRAFVETLP